MMKILEIGSNTVDGPPIYAGMENVEVLCIEPQTDTWSGHPSLPYTVGNGRKATLYICKGTGMTSLLKPNRKILDNLWKLKDLGRVVETKEVKTVRLDDIKEIDYFDFLKMDVQGSELPILKSGKEKLKRCLAIDLEVSFFPLYEKQPLFSEVDAELKKQGFNIFKVVSAKYWPINGHWRLIEADCLYVKDNPDDPNGYLDKILSHYERE
jgi:FkbM family methyltransferase